MKALVFDEELILREIAQPRVLPGEALVKVLMAGICNTDVEISRGYMNFKGVPGHEFVGVVESSPVAEQLGARVVGEINAGCGECSWCRAAMARHCSNRTVLGILGRNGAFAEYLTLPAGNLIPVPDSVSNEKAVFTEPLAAALEILEQVKIKPADSVLVIGDGKLGLLICMVLRLTGCRLTLMGKHPEKLQLFRSMGGEVIIPTELAETAERFDVVVEASGHPSGWSTAVERVKPRGTLVLKSTYHGDLSFNPAPLVINEITVVGSRCGLLGPALRLMENGLADPTILLSEVFPFSDAEKAFKRSQDAGMFKILLQF